MRRGSRCHRPDDDEVDLDCLPHPGQVQQAREIIRGLREGKDYRDFHGKKLNGTRDVVSIPIGQRFRMIARIVDGTPKPLAVMSHERYNRMNFL